MTLSDPGGGGSEGVLVVDRRPVEDGDVVGGAKFLDRVAEALGGEEDGPERSGGAGDDADQRRRGESRPRSGEDRRLEDLRRLGLVREVLGESGHGIEPEHVRQPGGGEIALDQRALAPGGGRGGRQADREFGSPLFPGDQDHALADLRPQRQHRVEALAVERPRAAQGYSPQHRRPRGSPEHHMRSGAEIPSRPSEPAIVRIVSRQSASRACSTPSPSAPTT